MEYLYAFIALKDIAPEELSEAFDMLIVADRAAEAEATAEA